MAQIPCVGRPDRAPPQGDSLRRGTGRGGFQSSNIHLVVIGAAAAARINLAVAAVAPGVARAPTSVPRRITAGAVIAVAAAGMLVVAVFANLEPPG